MTQFKRKIGIKKKIIAIVCLSISISMLILVGTFYIFGFRLLHNNIGKKNQQLAYLAASQLAYQLSGEIEDLSTYASRLLWIEYLIKENSKYENMPVSEIQKSFADIDIKWAGSGEDSPLVKEYTNNIIGKSVRSIRDVRRNVAEVFITNKFGGLVAASGKTSDFYQADEEWWQKAFNDGKGDVFVGNIEFDESTATWVVPIASAIKNDHGEVVGVCKEGISIDRLLNQLKELHVGDSGHAVLVDSKCSILFHPILNNVPVKFGAKYLCKYWPEKQAGYFTSRNSHGHKKSLLQAFAKVDSYCLDKAGIKWAVFIDQDLGEAFTPLSRMTAYLLVVSLIMIIIMWPIGFFIGDIFTKPIHDLHIATERIIEGDLDYTIRITTGDEIEQFADAFSKMVKTVKNEQEKLKLSKNEVEKLSVGLERKVEERTKDLQKMQEATLNILEDLTESKGRIEKYSATLEKALKIKSDFTSTVSHELRTPLAAIKESISIVFDETAGKLSDKQKEFLGISKRNVDRLTRLINDLLDFQKMESGKQIFNFTENDMNEIVKNAGSEMAVLAKNKGLTLELKLKDALPKIKFDNDRISQVLINLIGNALKYTDTGSITMTTSNDSDSIIVSVKDTGIGINKEEIPKLFQQFNQLDSISDRRVGGTGLGLAISKKIIDAHNGRMWTESIPGKGSTFSFSLPISRRV